MYLTGQISSHVFLLLIIYVNLWPLFDQVFKTGRSMGLPRTHMYMSNQIDVVIRHETYVETFELK
jgi:hypothetical protein